MIFSSVILVQDEPLTAHTIASSASKYSAELAQTQTAQTEASSLDR